MYGRRTHRSDPQPVARGHALRPVSPAPRDAERESDRVYETLKAKIVRIGLAPGAVLNESDLMRQLDTGRTPLREALQRLVIDRLVVVLPRRGTMVAGISIDDLRQIWEVRLPIEGHGARLAAERMTDPEIAALGDLVDRAATAVTRGGDFHALGEIDRLLHFALAAGARNEHLADTLGRLYSLTQRIWYFTQRRAPQKDRMMHVEWRAVVEAIRRRDGYAAEQAMREHVMQAKSSLHEAM